MRQIALLLLLAIPVTPLVQAKTRHNNAGKKVKVRKSAKKPRVRSRTVRQVN